MKYLLFIFSLFCFSCFGKTIVNLDSMSQVYYLAKYLGVDYNSPPIDFFVFLENDSSLTLEYNGSFNLDVIPEQAYSDYIMSLPDKYVLVTETGLVEMTEYQKIAFDAEEQRIEEEKEAARQASKPLERKQYENQFFALTEQLFNLTGVTNDVTPKLGFPELQAKIEQIQATDPMAAVNLSLKLLTIDAALKRYDTLWWDDAIQHELPEN